MVKAVLDSQFQPMALVVRDFLAAAEKAVAYYQENSALTSWEEVAALKGVGADLSWAELPAYSREDVQYGAATVAGYALGLLSSDVNPRTYFEDVDLLLQLRKLQQENGGFGDAYLSHTVYAVLALESVSGYLYQRDAAREYLLNQQDESGAYGYADWQTGAFVADVDTTAMALQALACFAGDQDVDAAIRKAVDFLKSKRLEDGGFPGWDGVTPNCNSAAVVLSGLVAVNADLTDWTDTIRSLLSFQREDGSFVYTADETVPNALATRQALLAIGDVINGSTAYQRLAPQIQKAELLYADGGMVGGSLADYVVQAHELGLMVGTTSQTCQPQKYVAFWELETVMGRLGLEMTHEDREHTVTREEVALALYQALDLPEGTTQPTDLDQVSGDPEIHAAVSAVMDAGIMVGTGGGNFRPDQYLTREQLCKVAVLSAQYGK